MKGKIFALVLVMGILVVVNASPVRAQGSWSFDPGTGMLTISGDATNNDFTVTVMAGEVIIADFGGTGVQASDVNIIEITGGGGADLIHLEAVMVADFPSVCDNVTISGEGGPDTIVGSECADTINGDGGNDDIRGGPGNDTIDGGDGNDDLRGGADDDIITGGDGVDAMRGGTGLDALSGWSEDDRLAGGDDDDTLEIKDSGLGGALVLANGGGGTDTLDADYDGGDDSLTLTQSELSNADTIRYSDIENLTVHGGGGTDDLVILGRDGDDAMMVGGIITGANFPDITLITIEDLTIDAERDSDNYLVDAGSLGRDIAIDDTDAGGVHPQDNDVLTVDLGGNDYTHTPTAPGAGIIVVAGNTITYSGIEEVVFINAAVAPPVPTLTEWAAMLMAGLLLLGGWLALRRRNAEV